MAWDGGAGGRSRGGFSPGGLNAELEAVVFSEKAFSCQAAKLCSRGHPNLDWGPP